MNPLLSSSSANVICWSPDTGADGRSAYEIELDIEQRRQAIDRRLDDLTTQASPLNAVGGLLNVDLNDPERAVRKLAGDAKDNPLPIALIGAGLLSYWFSNKSSLDQGNHPLSAVRQNTDAHDYTPIQENDMTKENATASTKLNAKATVKSAASAVENKAEKVASSANKAVNAGVAKAKTTKNQAADALSNAADTAVGAGQNAVDTAKSAAQTARDKVEDTAQAVTDTVADTAQTAADTLKNTAQTASETARDAADTIAKGVDDAYIMGRVRAEEIIESIPREAREVVETGSAWVRRNPVSSVLLGVAAGALIGSIFSARRSEPVYRREVRHYTDSDLSGGRRL